LREQRQRELGWKKNKFIYLRPPSTWPLIPPTPPPRPLESRPLSMSAQQQKQQQLLLITCQLYWICGKETVAPTSTAF